MVGVKWLCRCAVICSFHRSLAFLCTTMKGQGDSHTSPQIMVFLLSVMIEFKAALISHDYMYVNGVARSKEPHRKLSPSLFWFYSRQPNCFGSVSPPLSSTSFFKKHYLSSTK